MEDLNQGRRNRVCWMSSDQLRCKGDKVDLRHRRILRDNDLYPILCPIQAVMKGTYKRLSAHQADRH